MNENGKTEKGYSTAKRISVNCARVEHIFVSIKMIFVHFETWIHSQLFDRDSRVWNVAPCGLLAIRSETYIVNEIFFVNIWLHAKFRVLGNRLPFVKSYNLINLIELTKSYLVEWNQIRGINWVNLIFG